MNEINLEKQNKATGFFSIKNIGIILLFLAVSAFFFGFGLGVSRFFLSDKQDPSVLMQQMDIPLEERVIEPNISSNSISYIFDDVSRSVVSVNNMQLYRDFLFNNIERTSQGSGVVIDEDETNLIIITNYHVIENSSELMVAFAEYNEAEASIVGYDQDTDLAFLSVEKSSLPEDILLNIKVASLGDSDRLRVGERVLAIGNPLGITNTVTDGIVSGLQRSLNFTDRSLRLIQTNAAINPGNSGGALVNMNGEIIGINTAKISGTQVEGLAFAIPINHAKVVFEEILDKGYVSRPFLGIIGSDVAGAALDYPFDVGVLVRGVIDNSAAKVAGIEEGDIIAEFNDKKIIDMEDLVRAISETRVGEQITITIIREGEEQRSIEVRMLERESS